MQPFLHETTSSCRSFVCRMAPTRSVKSMKIEKRKANDFGIDKYFNKRLRMDGEPKDQDTLIELASSAAQSEADPESTTVPGSADSGEWATLESELSELIHERAEESASVYSTPGTDDLEQLQPAVDPTIRNLDNGYELTAENVQRFEKMCQEQAQKAAPMLEQMSEMSKKDKKKHDAFEACINSGELDPRSALGQELSKLWKDKDSEVGKRYHKLNRAQAAEFRIELAKTQFKLFKQEKVHLRSWQRIDTTKGEYRPLGWIVIEEGGWDDPEAVAGTKCLVNRCMWMGSPWWMINPQTGRVNYLYLKFQFKEEFTKAWKSYTIEYEEAKNKATTTTTPVPETPREDSTVQQQTPPGLKKSPKPPTTDNVTLTAGKGNETSKLWAESSKLKAKTLAAKAGAEQVLVEIEQNPAWSWAANNQNENSLRAALKALNDAHSEFHKEFLTTTSLNLKGMKRKYNRETCNRELTTFIATEFLMQKLVKTQTTLVERRNVD